mmetsp:Transcript_24175/g.82523  ORF Transcript_24175/g.82523 Transcript_24175/m.82523 type:complete len:403 (-) Transcript_24175:287-1495(-)
MPPSKRRYGYWLSIPPCTTSGGYNMARGRWKWMTASPFRNGAAVCNRIAGAECTMFATGPGRCGPRAFSASSPSSFTSSYASSFEMLSRCACGSESSMRLWPGTSSSSSSLSSSSPSSPSARSGLILSGLGGGGGSDTLCTGGSTAAPAPITAFAGVPSVRRKVSCGSLRSRGTRSGRPSGPMVFTGWTRRFPQLTADSHSSCSRSEFSHLLTRFTSAAVMASSSGVGSSRSSSVISSWWLPSVPGSKRSICGCANFLRPVWGGADASFSFSGSVPGRFRRDRGPSRLSIAAGLPLDVRMAGNTTASLPPSPSPPGPFPCVRNLLMLGSSASCISSSSSSSSLSSSVSSSNSLESLTFPSFLMTSASSSGPSSSSSSSSSSTPASSNPSRDTFPLPVCEKVT